MTSSLLNFLSFRFLRGFGNVNRCKSTTDLNLTLAFITIISKRNLQFMLHIVWPVISYFERIWGKIEVIWFFRYLIGSLILLVLVLIELLVLRWSRCGGIGGGRTNDVWDAHGSLTMADRGLISRSSGGGHSEGNGGAGLFRSDGTEWDEKPTAAPDHCDELAFVVELDAPDIWWNSCR